MNESLLKLTNREGLTVAVNLAHVISLEPIQAHAKPHTAVVMNHRDIHGNTKTIIVQEPVEQILGYLAQG